MSAAIFARAWDRRRKFIELRSIAEAMPDALVYFDADDRFLIWNRRYELTLAPYGIAPRFGQTFDECDPRRQTDGDLPVSALEARQLRQTQTSNSREMRGPDGRWLRVEERQVAGGGRIVVVFDISTLMDATDNLALARDAAEAANRAKSEFLANMSHEIRTPLNGVMGVADALTLTPLSASQLELVQIIRSSGASLTRLLGDLLDLARVESGAVQLVNEPFNLAAAVKSVAQLSAVSAHEKGIAFRLDVAPQANQWVLGDQGRLKQILTNLTSNAVKFTDVGEVELCLVCFDEREGRFRFTVRDTGPGIDSEMKARLFGRFHQGDAAMNRRAGGSGLGLSIARQLATAMGGELDMQSVVGKGSTFTLTLDLRPVEAPAERPHRKDASPAIEAAAEAEPPTPASRVLVADDHPNNRRLMQVLLDHLGCESAYAEDGQQAVDAWRTGNFDVILMDLQMPVMDGLEATRAIRAAEIAERRARVPIIVISANAMPQHLEASRRAGADDHISKPVAVDRLFAALSQISPASDDTASEARTA